MFLDDPHFASPGASGASSVQLFKPPEIRREEKRREEKRREEKRREEKRREEKRREEKRNSIQKINSDVRK